MGDSRILIITGMSGAGKTQVMRALEDLNYFCVDNLPPAFIPKFAELCAQTSGKVSRIALVVDIRGGKFFDEMLGILDELQNNDIKYDLLYLDATNKTIINRYKETRRRHPLASNVANSLSELVDKERVIVEKVRCKATHIIDTTEMSTSALREKIIVLYGDDTEYSRMNVVIQSFGFKYGMPVDADMLFDVRFLPNPFYIQELKEKTGNDLEVADYIWNHQVTKQFMKKLDDLVLFLLPQYVREGKSQLTIAVGCTGGHHRSVFVANRLADLIKEEGYIVRVTHRDIEKE